MDLKIDQKYKYTRLTRFRVVKTGIFVFFIDFEVLLAPLSAPVGSHECTFSATVFESLFNKRFHEI